MPRMNKFVYTTALVHPLVADIVLLSILAAGWGLDALVQSPVSFRMLGLLLCGGLMIAWHLAVRIALSQNGKWLWVHTGGILCVFLLAGVSATTLFAGFRLEELEQLLIIAYGGFLLASAFSAAKAIDHGVYRKTKLSFVWTMLLALYAPLGIWVLHSRIVRSANA